MLSTQIRRAVNLVAMELLLIAEQKLNFNQIQTQTSLKLCKLHVEMKQN